MFFTPETITYYNQHFLFALQKEPTSELLLQEMTNQNRALSFKQ